MTKTALLFASALVCVPAVAFAKGDKDDKSEKSDKGSDEKSTDTDKAGGEETTIAQKSNAPPEAMDSEEGKLTDVREKNSKYYYFIGFRYRGTVVPQFIMNLFVDGGRTVYNSAAGIEIDIRKDGFSMIPSLMLMEHAMEPTMFLQKGKNPDEAGGGNWSIVAADLKGLYGAVDLLWSAKMAKNFDFEFGFGVGIGVIMGDILDNWVNGGAGPGNGPYTAYSNGKLYSFTPCGPGTDAPGGPLGCQPISHSNGGPPPTVHKVGFRTDPVTGKVIGGYTEPGWTSGGVVPSIFPYLSIPILGLRIKPIKALEMRPQLGFSPTGFYFQLSANYGFERPTK